MNFITILFLSTLLLASSFNDDFPFDKTKLENYDKKTDINSFFGVIKNQIWIASKKLSQKELEDLVLNQYNFKIIGYNKVYGLLIQFDETDQTQLQIIKDIRTMNNIDNVYNRVYEGSRAFKVMPSITNTSKGE
ncbi:MAG: hypothetical protein KAQ94_10150 [Arcobacteraceae bacterium]|nr:hypothetical protein [Arcobacteraceae bacterium]